MKKIALVTGAGRGIGRAIAVSLAEAGMHVIVNYNSSEAGAAAAVKEITEAGGSASTYQCDVSDYEDSKKMIDEVVKEYGRIDVLVNNAGITKDNIIMRMSEEDFDDVLRVNLKSAFNTTKHLSRYLLKQRSGRIINISSVSGVLGNAGQANYSASKAGIIGLTKSTARELAPRGVTCNAVAPGFIDTDMTMAMNDAAKNTMVSQIPLGRIGEASDVAYLVAFLASEQAGYITGQVFSVDGGMAI